MNEGIFHTWWRTWCIETPWASTEYKRILCGLCCWRCGAGKMGVLWLMTLPWLLQRLIHGWSFKAEDFFSSRRIYFKNQMQLMLQEMWYLATLVYTCNRRYAHPKPHLQLDFVYSIDDCIRAWCIHLFPRQILPGPEISERIVIQWHWFHLSD